MIMVDIREHQVIVVSLLFIDAGCPILTITKNPIYSILFGEFVLM